MYAGIAAVVSVWITMIIIIVYKHWDDFYAVFVTGTGD